MKKDNKIKKYLILVLASFISALLYAIAIKCFIQRENVNMLANGLAGLAIIFSRLGGRLGLNIDVVYSLSYTIMNVPIMIMAYKRIGKVYTLFTLINIGMAAILNIVLPSSMFDFMALNPITDRLLISIMAGVLAGISSGIALKFGTSTGGIDTVITFLGIKYNKQVGGYMLIINAAILIAGGLLFREWNAMLYTIVFIFVGSQVVDLIYRRTKKRLLKIVTSEKEKMADEILKVSKHGVTIFECEGAYSKTKKYEVQTIVLESEVKSMIALAQKVDPHCFTSVFNCYETKGNYTMPDIE